MRFAAWCASGGAEMRAEIDNDAGKTIQRPWATFLSSRDRAFEVRAKLSWDAAAEYTPRSSASTRRNEGPVSPERASP